MRALCDWLGSFWDAVLSGDDTALRVLWVVMTAARVLFIAAVAALGVYLVWGQP